MIKIVVITIVCVISLIAGVGNYRQSDNLNQEGEKNILLDIENEVFEENIVQEEIGVIENTVKEDNIIKEDKVENKTSVSNVKENNKTETIASNKKQETTKSKEDYQTNNKTIEQNTNKKEDLVQEKKEETKEYKQEDKIKQEVEQNTKEEVKEEIVIQETKYEYVYNYNETQRLKNDVEEIAKQNADLFDSEGNKLYRVSEFSNKEQAMNRTNYFSPYNIQEVKGVVLNTYSCTFLVYAIDYKINGILQQTRYYIKITEF